METPRFRFFTALHLVQSTGRRAAGLREFLAVVREVEPESLCYHLHQAYRKYALAVPEFPTDFASWAAHDLKDPALAEKLAMLDLFGEGDLETLRGTLVRLLEGHVQETGEDRRVWPGDEFHFNRAVTVVVPTRFQADSLDELRKVLRTVDSGCVYYHLYEGRIRSGGRDDDFAVWLRQAAGRPDLADQVARLDPFQLSHEAARSALLTILDQGV